MARLYSADSAAAPAAAWSLVSEPARWPEWSPHLRGAWNLGWPEVQQGKIGAARLLWVVPIPARITAKTPGESWTWHVGPMRLVHSVMPLPSGCRITMALSAPGPLENALGVTYGPVVQRLTTHLARVAERSSSGEATRTSAPAATSSSRVP